MAERIREAGPGLDFEHQLGEVDTGHPGIDRVAQVEQALRLLQLVERRQNQVWIATDFLDPHAGILGQIGGRLSECLVETLAEALQLVARLARHAERAAHGGAGCFPCSPFQQSFPGVAVAKARPDEQVPSPDGGTHPVEQTETIAGHVDGAASIPHLVHPVVRNEGSRGRAWTPLFVEHGAQILDSLHNRLAGRGRCE